MANTTSPGTEDGAGPLVAVVRLADDRVALGHTLASLSVQSLMPGLVAILDVGAADEAIGITAEPQPVHLHARSLAEGLEELQRLVPQLANVAIIRAGLFLHPFALRLAMQVAALGAGLVCPPAMLGREQIGRLAEAGLDLRRYHRVCQGSLRPGGPLPNEIRNFAAGPRRSAAELARAAEWHAAPAGWRHADGLRIFVDSSGQFVLGPPRPPETSCVETVPIDEIAPYLVARDHAPWVWPDLLMPGDPLPSCREPLDVSVAIPVRDRPLDMVGAADPPTVARDRRRRVDPDTALVQLDEVKVHAQPTTGRKQLLVYTALVMTAGWSSHFATASGAESAYQVGALSAVLGIYRGTRSLLVLADGAGWIRDWFEGLGLKDKAMIVCWYHVKKRCEQCLSRACRGRDHRREVEVPVLKALWRGRVEEAITTLPDRAGEMKDLEALEELIGYLEARRAYLPDYEARQRAGLWIASNRVEKLNDWSMSVRCKHRGMEWTAPGVVGLASLEAARRNGELAQWRAQRSLPAGKVPPPGRVAA